MAKLIIIKKHSDYYEFSLSNKPDKVFMCDIEDIDIFNKRNWYVHSSDGKLFYIRSSNTCGSHEHFHREILNAPEYSVDCVVDHINNNCFDCRKSNLRICSQRENMSNRKRGFGIYVQYKSYIVAITEIKRIRNGKEFTYYQSYSSIFKKHHCIGSSKCLDTMKRRVLDYIIKGDAKNGKEG